MQVMLFSDSQSFALELRGDQSGVLEVVDN